MSWTRDFIVVETLARKSGNAQNEVFSWKLKPKDPQDDDLFTELTVETANLDIAEIIIGARVTLTSKT